MEKRAEQPLCKTPLSDTFSLVNDTIRLTPVEEYLIKENKGLQENNGAKILLKRDDKFCLGMANGGKLRQAITLLLMNKEKIISLHNSSVVCSCSIKSPQSGIIATACSLIGFKCNVVVYKTKEANPNLTIAEVEGAKIFGSPSGYNSVIESYAKKYFPKDFFTNMGFSAKEIIKANTQQVENIPDDLDYLVVPVGSAMNFVSILYGLNLYGKKPKNIVGVYVGKSPFKNLHKYYTLGYPKYEMIKYDKPYGTWVDIDDCFFDPIYEAKAYDWILKNVDCSKNKVMLWVVGKRNLDIVPKPVAFKDLKISERRLN